MSDGYDPIREAVAALRARGHTVEPWTGGLPYWLVDGELERWQIGEFHFSDADLWRLAASRGLVEDGDSR